MLAILAMNVASFAGPSVASGLPAYDAPASVADKIAFAFGWIFVEGKMRAVFTLLFGAGLVIFHDRAVARGENGIMLQARRLIWLAVFGYLHFLLLWRGDVLLPYAVAGFLLLPLVHLRTTTLAGLGAAGTIAGSIALAALAALYFAGAQAVGDAYDAAVMAKAESQIAEDAMGFAAQVAFRLGEKPFYPFELLAVTLYETLPLMLIGMAMARGGLFSGKIGRTALARGSSVALLLGTTWSALSLFAHWQSGLTLTAASLMPYYTDLPARTAAGIGMVLLIVLTANRLAPTWLGRRLIAAGRMAFSNYLLTSLVMTGLFHGWGLALASAGIGRAEQWLFVVGGWTAMLAWSAPWLARFGTGPLEWAWKRLR